MCQITLLWGFLSSHENILPLLGIFEAKVLGRQDTKFFHVIPYMEHGTLSQWRRKANPPGLEIRDRMLEVARAVQYIHSLGLVLCWLPRDYILIDSNFHAKVLGLCMSLQCLSETPLDHMSLHLPELRTREYNIFRFGCIYYEIYFGVEMDPSSKVENRTQVVKRLTEPEIPDDEWDLIQRCCAEDPKSRPAIDEIVKEMESWSFL